MHKIDLKLFNRKDYLEDIEHSMRMNKYVYVLLVFAVAFTAMQLLTWSTAEAGKKYPKLRADAGDDFKTLKIKRLSWMVLIAKADLKNLLILNGN